MRLSRRKKMSMMQSIRGRMRADSFERKARHAVTIEAVRSALLLLLERQNFAKKIHEASMSRAAATMRSRGPLQASHSAYDTTL